jgi:hypothetical protein
MSYGFGARSEALAEPSWGAEELEAGADCRFLGVWLRILAASCFAGCYVWRVDCWFLGPLSFEQKPLSYSQNTSSSKKGSKRCDVLAGSLGGGSGFKLSCLRSCVSFGLGIRMSMSFKSPPHF